ncbi:putative SAM-dependent methyltransferase [Xylariales sp. PMI_506]|nr:putative SAM-dependent methyltransferase [Xylariales sp. PMI_506]
MADSLEVARYAALKWNCPLHQRHADDLLDLLQLQDTASLIDLGCGWGELTLLAATRMPRDSIVSGVDTDKPVIERAIRLSAERDIPVQFALQEAQQWATRTERAICIGASHALGGTRAMLDKMARIVPTGRVLVGDTCWEKEPTEAAKAMFEEVMSLQELVATCRESGWQVLHLSVADQREWDDFESGHRAGPREWLITNKLDPRATDVEVEHAAREQKYLETYRGQLGFAYVILGR